MIADLAAQGMAIILISSEMPELSACATASSSCARADRTAEFSSAEATQEKVLERRPTKTGERARPGGAGGAMPRARRTKSGPLDVLKRREFGLLAAMLAVVIPVTIINPRMVSAANLTAVAMDAALLVVAALAQMLVLITRNIDLSVASVIGLAAYMARPSMVRPIRRSTSASAWRPPARSAVSPGCSTGWSSPAGRMPAIVVTLATMSIFRGFN